MDDKIRQRNEEASAELDEMFKRARPIKEMWDHARGELGIGALNKEKLVGLVLKSAESLHDDRILPLPKSIRDLAELHDIWLREVVGLSAVISSTSDKSNKTLDEAVLAAPEAFPPQTPTENRLARLVSRLAYAQSQGKAFSRDFSDPVRRAAEGGFTIVARRMVEKCVAEGMGFEAAAEKIMAVSKEIRNPAYIRTKEWIELEVQMLREEFVCSKKQRPCKDGIAVDAPAFEKRPVQGSRTPNGKTPKPIKR